jgi:DNA-binding transcriptional LysR family regulator
LLDFYWAYFYIKTEGREPMPTLTDPPDLELLLALGANGSLRSAAKAADMHHATAFRRLEALEARWGTRLFERLLSGYVPTEAGRAVLASAKSAKAALLELEGIMAARDQRIAGAVVVTTSDGLAQSFVPSLLARIGGRYRGLAFEMRVDNALSDLSLREVDIAIRPARKLVGQLVGRRVAKVAFALYGSPTYLAAHTPHPVGVPLERQALTGHNIAAVLAPMTQYSVGDWLSRNVARPVPAAFSANQFGALLGWAEAGGGLAVLPCVLGDSKQGLRRFGAPIAAMEVGLWLCTHPHVRKVPRVRAVLDALGEEIALAAPALKGELA